MPISSNLFAVGKERKIMVAEISDLGKDFHFERVYQDACDEGLVLVSAKTGDHAKFYVHEIVRDESGDIQVWVLKPIIETIWRVRNIKGWEIHILND